MVDIREFIFGPWRAISVLAVTQILAWGTIYYPIVLTAPIMAADRGWSKTFTMAGFSTGLLIAGLASRQVGILIDRHGGHRVMPAGSLMGGIGLVGLTLAGTPVLYFITWAVLGVAMAVSLYDPAFATIGRIFGGAARRPITMLTVVGGLASTMSWPSTHALIDSVGWQNTYFLYAALLVFVAAPLHCWALPRRHAEVEPRSPSQPRDASVLPPDGPPFALVSAGFAAFAFVLSGLSAHLLALFQGLGLTADSAVIIGAVIGPSQVVARIGEFLIGREVHPLRVVRGVLALLILAFAMLGAFGVSIATAAVFAVAYGLTNGLMTIARGTLPLALFGPTNYGRLIGRIARPLLIMQATAPFLLAFVAERQSDMITLALVAAVTIVSLACFSSFQRPNA